MRSVHVLLQLIFSDKASLREAARGDFAVESFRRVRGVLMDRASVPVTVLTRQEPFLAFVALVWPCPFWFVDLLVFT